MKGKGHNRKPGTRNKVIRYLKVPFKALGKARDFYVRSLTSCASRIGHGHCPSHFPVEYYELPRSFCESSSPTRNVNKDDDITELIRAASVRSSSYGNEMDMFSPKQLRLKMRSRGLPKNMGRIDEDKPCVFEDNDVVFEMKRKCRIKSQHQQPMSEYKRKV
ncbi:hypothetical protein Golob_011204 [Gossypium lobatum]|uniref:Uncharacterized protein n=1 Tax=Gossypium lobatum TaxID=34289 RepID=A0A7J8MP86_9ROSI|nr:hypothetical protein [Gossypium lobatum]